MKFANGIFIYTVSRDLMIYSSQGLNRTFSSTLIDMRIRTKISQSDRQLYSVVSCLN